MDQEEKSFQTERTNTDRSLVEERQKTNISIAQTNVVVEKTTDEKVQNHRTEADEDTLAARKHADSQQSPTNLTVETKNENLNDQRLSEERDRSDAAIEQERTRVDNAFIKEREVRSVNETKMLENEREKTDQNLKIERNSADSVLQETSLQLTTEVKEHSKTKTSLTTRDELLAIVSHDLRNPIGAISSCMEFLLEESEERKLSEDTKTWLRMAKRNADSSLRLISDILDMERMGEGKMELVKREHDIKSIVEEAAECFSHSAALKRITIVINPASSIMISCDRDRILQVLSNLIGNALKYSPKNSKIILSIESSNAFLTVSIRDEGPGIPKEKTKEIFEKFAQLKSKDRTGLGLGLHISKMLIEAHNGILWVESRIGTGSTFSFRLPITL